MNYIRAHRIWVLSGIIVVLLIVAVSRLGGEPIMNESVAVTRGDVVAQVAVTGRVKAAEDVNLAFERGGKIASINVRAGDKVYRGQTLASLSMADLLAAVASAKASVASQQASLDALKIGSRPEDVSIAQVKFDNAKLEFENKTTLQSDTVSAARVAAESAIKYYIDQFYTSPDSASPTFNIVTGNSRDTDLNFARVVAGETLKSFSGKTSLESLRAFVTQVAMVINSMTPTANYSASTIDGYKVAVNTARTSIETQITNVTAASQAWQNAQADLNLAGKQLELAKAPARIEDIQVGQAKLDQLNAQVLSAQAEASKAVITAPFSGIVTKQDFKLGETVNTGDARISLASTNTYEIEANVPEADVATVAVGQKAQVTLDAYGPDISFPSTVVAIDPGETIIDGVATYKTTLQFDSADNRIKSGMTANVTIETAAHKGVLMLPSRMINEEGGKSFVNVGTDVKTAVKTEVVVGLHGFDGSVEIVSGLSEGEQVIN
ncbi:MAG TPA: efflux RND transporter periplasmic adaptor subunit [Candidatus Paceibacterota bacterium]